MNVWRWTDFFTTESCSVNVSSPEALSTVEKRMGIKKALNCERNLRGSSVTEWGSESAKATLDQWHQETEIHVDQSVEKRKSLDFLLIGHLVFKQFIEHNMNVISMNVFLYPYISYLLKETVRLSIYCLKDLLQAILHPYFSPTPLFGSHLPDSSPRNINYRENAPGHFS